MSASSFPVLPPRTAPTPRGVSMFGSFDPRATMSPVARLKGGSVPILSRSFGSVMSNDDNDETFDSYTGGSSARAAFILMLKAFICTGILFLPNAVLKAGWTYSICVMPIMGLWTYYCIYLLCDCGRAETYQAVSESINGKVGRYAQSTVKLFVFLSQCGFALVYLVFVGQTAQRLIAYSTFCRVEIALWMAVLVQVLVLVPLSWVRFVSQLGVACLIAEVCIVVGLCFVLGEALQSIGTVGAATGLEMVGGGWPEFVGTSIFVFEGVTLVLPIRASMSEASQRRFGLVSSATIFVVCTVSLGFAVVLVVAFGKGLTANVMVSIPQDLYENVFTLPFNLGTPVPATAATAPAAAIAAAVPSVEASEAASGVPLSTASLLHHTVHSIAKAEAKQSHGGSGSRAHTDNQYRSVVSHSGVVVRAHPLSVSPSAPSIFSTAPFASTVTDSTHGRSAEALKAAHSHAHMTVTPTPTPSAMWGADQVRIGLVQVIQLLYCIAVVLTVPLQLFPAAVVVEDLLGLERSVPAEAVDEEVGADGRRVGSNGRRVASGGAGARRAGSSGAGASATARPALASPIRNAEASPLLPAGSATRAAYTSDTASPAVVGERDPVRSLVTVGDSLPPGAQPVGRAHAHATSGAKKGVTIAAVAAVSADDRLAAMLAADDTPGRSSGGAGAGQVGVGEEGGGGLVANIVEHRVKGVSIFKSFVRSVLVISLAVLGVAVSEYLDKVVALIGAFCCMPLALVLPPLFHLMLAAKTPLQKYVDGGLVAAGVGVMVFVTIYTFYSFSAPPEPPVPCVVPPRTG